MYNIIEIVTIILFHSANFSLAHLPFISVGFLFVFQIIQINFKENQIKCARESKKKQNKIIFVYNNKMKIEMVQISKYWFFSFSPEDHNVPINNIESIVCIRCTTQYFHLQYIYLILKINQRVTYVTAIAHTICLISKKNKINENAHLHILQHT